MEYNIGVGKSRDAAACVQEATAKFRNPRLILFFSPIENFEQYTELMHQKFPDSVCMGATSIAMFHRDGAEKNVLKAVGIENGIRCSADVLENVDKYPIKYVERVKRCVDEVRDTRNTICLEFTTALLCAEESVLAALNSVLLDKGIPVFGGTAGDAGTATGTKVSLNGRVCEKSSVFAIIHNENGAIKVFRENIYKPMTGNILTVTKADGQKRTVYEYNHQPAAKMFAQELGVTESQVTGHFDTNPMGRVVGGEVYITANCSIVEKQGIMYHARVYNNSKLVVMEPDNYREIIAQTVQKIRQEVPRPSFAIMCHCLARTLLFDGDGYLTEYAKIMGSVLGNYIGFSGYGEQYGEENFNQTMIVAVFE
ncbi:MAG: hypothetical protein GX234_01630 [Clostridiales bacterium]|nr:hypothetical protein [Clostridiales bacterium]